MAICENGVISPPLRQEPFTGGGKGKGRDTTAIILSRNESKASSGEVGAATRVRDNSGDSASTEGSLSFMGKEAGRNVEK